MKTKKEIIEKITQKKEFSKLRKIDVEMAFEKFDKKEFSDLDKIKLTRDLLRKVFSAFTSQKLLSIKDKDPEWFLKKHLSTKERFDFYEKLYSKILTGNETVFDLGAGVNGFSYNFLPKGTNYIGIEAMGQLVELMNYYFNNLKVTSNKKLDAGAIHLSLFELEKLKKYFKQVKGKKIVFLFKALDSLEMMQRDYSKKLLVEIFPLVDTVVLSFATRSLIKKTKFKVQRKWIIDFVKNNFEILEDFELGNERYIVLKKKEK